MEENRKNKDFFGFLCELEIARNLKKRFYQWLRNSSDKKGFRIEPTKMQVILIIEFFNHILHYNFQLQL